MGEFRCDLMVASTALEAWGWNSFRQKAGKGQGFGDQSRRSRNRQSAGAIDLLSSVSMLRLSAPMPL